MARTFDSPRHDALREFLVKKRKEAGLRQVDLAKRLNRRQDYVSCVETGQKLVEVLELMEWAEAVGFDAQDAIDATDSRIAGSPAFHRREID
jgi:transcriptional regulator with XRE-family HTH domain